MRDWPGGNRWNDFPEFILGITADIWEGRDVGGGIRRHYGRDVVVRTPAGVSRGAEATVTSTLATLATFPDRVLLGEDVIWSGDEAQGMLSSHRILSQATHAGAGEFGPPTGRRVTYRAIADCWARDGVIHDEWLVRDNAAILRQTGREPEAFVREELSRERAAGKLAAPFTPAADVAGPYAGRGNDNEWGQRYEDILTRLMGAEFSAIPAEYDRACQLEMPGGETGHGHCAADRFWLPLRAAFPNAEFAVHHRIGREDAGLPPRAAIRWSLTGRHEGWGRFGAPSGAVVHVMGISHAEFGPWGVRREFTLFDEIAIWRQILAVAD